MSPRMERSCFVIRSHEDQLRNVWELAIAPALSEFRVDVVDPKQGSYGPDTVNPGLASAIWAADFVVAELSKPSAGSMYLLALAHAAKKPTITILEKSANRPFTAAHASFLRYDGNGLSSLRAELVDELAPLFVGSTPVTAKVEHFPELQILTEELSEELDYLRSRLSRIVVSVSPSCAEIFCNGRLVGNGQAEVYINPVAPRNTISAATVGFFDHHRELRAEDVQSGQLAITLERIEQEGEAILDRTNRRLPAWLRDRRRDPQNPVLMKAVSNYLLLIGERDDAFEEIEELLEVAPNWHLSYIQMGLHLGLGEGVEEAIDWYQKAADICSYHFISHYSMACNHSLLGDLDSALRSLEVITANQDMLESIQASMTCLSRDPDFRNLWMSTSTRDTYRDIEQEIFGVRPDPETTVLDGVDGYIL